MDASVVVAIIAALFAGGSLWTAVVAIRKSSEANAIARGATADAKRSADAAERSAAAEEAALALAQREYVDLVLVPQVAGRWVFENRGTGTARNLLVAAAPDSNVIILHGVGPEDIKSRSSREVRIELTSSGANSEVLIFWMNPDGTPGEKRQAVH